MGMRHIPKIRTDASFIRSMEKILVLEDEVDIGNLVAFNLRRNGYDVEVEHDGREGLGRILKEQPDLVTLDLMMPGMDGYQVLKEMQRDPLIRTPNVDHF